MPELKVIINASPCGVYANACSISASQYEYTLRFLNVLHEMETDEESYAEAVSIVKMSHKCAAELLTALSENLASVATQDEIRALPESGRSDLPPQAA
jgi:hypothetical protein